MIRRETQLKKSWFESLIDDTTLSEKLVLILWCGLPYLIWLMTDNLNIIYKIILSICIFILLTLFCWLFGKFMSSEERDWN